MPPRMLNDDRLAGPAATALGSWTQLDFAVDLVSTEGGRDGGGVEGWLARPARFAHATSSAGTASRQACSCR